MQVTSPSPGEHSLGSVLQPREAGLAGAPFFPGMFWNFVASLAGGSHALGLIAISASLMSSTKALGCSQGQEARRDCRWVSSGSLQTKGPVVPELELFICPSAGTGCSCGCRQEGFLEEGQGQCSTRMSAPRCSVHVRDGKKGREGRRRRGRTERKKVMSKPKTEVSTSCPPIGEMG